MTTSTGENTNALDNQMLSALELFHYSYRFRDRVFVVTYDKEVNFEETISDLRVIESSHIKAVIVLQDYEGLREKLENWNERGSRYSYQLLSFTEVEKGGWLAEANAALAKDFVPVIAMNASSNVDEREKESILLNTAGTQIAGRLKADKLFMLSKQSGLKVHNVFYSHPTPEEVKRFVANHQGVNLSLELLKLIESSRNTYGYEVIVLECESGALFEEIFTHKGRGTLFSDRYPNEIRRAQLGDVKEIFLLIKANSVQNAVLPLTEDEICKSINDFFVYTINGALVATARLTDYGNWVELAKVCTLPRYQRRGRAHELAVRMIEEARGQGKSHVFSLSIIPKMWEFFSRLGFKEIDRHELPNNWQEHYNFNRPSKAFVLKL